MDFLASERILDRVSKLRTVVMRIKITGNATPADKVHRPDLGEEVVVLRSKGKTTDADAIEDLSAVFTTAADAANSVFGMILRKELTEDQFDGFGEIERVVDATAVDLAGNATSLTLLLLDGTGVTRGLTDDGNMAIQITGTGLNLTNENADIQLTVRYLLK